MSALAMILAAAMVVPGNGPEKVSGEIAEPQRLDLSGTWEGSVHYLYGSKAEVRLSGRILDLTGRNGRRGIMISFTDEGEKRVRLRSTLIDDTRDYLGIYHQDGDRLIASFGINNRPRDLKPTGQELRFILHRVKPRK